MAKGETYKEFVEKFKPKRTTDDCYTPESIYEVIKNWVCEEYKINEDKIVRPFYPGGDYENFDYTGNKIVVDNPPFSIFSKIIKFYQDNDIKFFLFGPHLTLFASDRQNVTYIIIDTKITYENGAKVNTSFVTNLDKDCLIRTAPKLKSLIKHADREFRKSVRKPLNKYTYPDNVISSSLLGKYSNKEIRIKPSEVHFIRYLDEQKKYKKSLFGGGYLISDEKAREIEKMKEMKEMEEKEDVQVWKLSEREKEIIKVLK